MQVLHYLILSIALLISLSGCNAVQLVVSFDPELQQLRDGEREFILGNYEEAEEIFSEIYDSNVSNQTKNTALYNLACTRIITSNTTDDFINAVELLEGWEKTYPSVIYVENPDLVISALKKRASFITQAQAKELKKDIMTKEILKKELKDKELESIEIITRQSQTITELEKSLFTLQHQIAELEAIDQQLQEKKKPL
ncbi:hypothetical protein [Desulfosediminicola flagellatus]|uniref:hypothetical protein n=1 Tax=Desulfosediminicola flagellatus TaxID=2569541 RepID=UPI0010AC70E5|nr:hypothetical protein [Desulfosediminicola flagellatus]